MTGNEDRKRGYEVSVIGCGGIGSWLLHGLARPARRFAEVNGVQVTIRVYDSDLVEEENVHHQNFRPDDVGKAKVDAVCEEMGAFQGEHLRFVPCAWDVRGDDDIGHTHLAVVAVDAPAAREYVTKSNKVGSWAICTCAGDSFLFLTEQASQDSISRVTQPGQAPASCQMPDAIAEGRIEGGHKGVALVAETWILRSLRKIVGETGARLPTPRAGSTVVGTLGYVAEASEEVVS